MFFIKTNSWEVHPFANLSQVVPLPITCYKEMFLQFQTSKLVTLNRSAYTETVQLLEICPFDFITDQFIHWDTDTQCIKTVMRHKVSKNLYSDWNIKRNLTSILIASILSKYGTSYISNTVSVIMWYVVVVQNGKYWVKTHWLVLQVG